MFEGFAHVWTPVERAARVKRRPVRVVVAGEAVVLFRGRDGELGALLDRCPHRGVALSLGRVDEDGALACPFHGWRFATDGACLSVPLDPDARCDLLGATALPVRERGGLIWIYTAPGREAQGEPAVPEALLDRAFVLSPLVVDWATHWTRAMENMLDTPHVPFVHRRTIGRALRRRMRPDSRLEMRWDPTATGGHIVGLLDGVPQAGGLDFERPNRMTLHIPIPDRRYRIHVWCVPTTAERARLIVVAARDFGRWNPLAPLFDLVNRLIVFEDRAIVESSQPKEVPPPGEERSVAGDRPTLQFRRYYYDVLRPSTARGDGAPPIAPERLRRPAA